MSLLKARAIGHSISIILLSILFILAGLNHFASPAFYVRIMPPMLPRPVTLVYVSGFFEIVGGIGMAVVPLRRAAGWLLIALLVAVYPANIYMAINPDAFPEFQYWLLLVRLPLQFVLSGWIWWCAILAPSIGISSTYSP